MWVIHSKLWHVEDTCNVFNLMSKMVESETNWIYVLVNIKIYEEVYKLLEGCKCMIA